MKDEQNNRNQILPPASDNQKEIKSDQLYEIQFSQTLDQAMKNSDP